MRARRPTRLKTFNYKGKHRYFVTCTTEARQKLFIKRLCKQRLWHDGYFERVLRPTDNVFEIIEYIRNNPANAELPTERAHYPYVWWTTQV